MTDAELSEALDRCRGQLVVLERKAGAAELSDRVRELSFLYESSLTVMAGLFARIDELQARIRELEFNAK